MPNSSDSRGLNVTNVVSLQHVVCKLFTRRPLVHDGKITMPHQAFVCSSQPLHLIHKLHIKVCLACAFTFAAECAKSIALRRSGSMLVAAFATVNVLQGVMIVTHVRLKYTFCTDSVRTRYTFCTDSVQIQYWLRTTEAKLCLGNIVECSLRMYAHCV